MRLHFPTRYLHWALQEASKSANQVFSRALTTLNYDHVGCPGDDQSFGHNENRSSNVDLEVLAQFLQHGYNPKPYILNQLVSSCAKLGSVDMGIQVHSAIIKMGFSSNVFICSALVDLYGKWGMISDGQRVFDEMPLRNAVTWNSLIFGYMHADCPDIAIKLFMNMLKIGISSTPFSVSAILGACTQLRAGELGILVHGLSLKAGFCNNVVVGTGLIYMYSKCWKLEDSRRVFNQMPERNVITWTSMVTGYAQNQNSYEGMTLVREMMVLGLRPNYVTYNSLLSSFSCPDDFNYGKQVHCRIICEGSESNAYLAVSLMTLYSECSSNLEDFRKICSGVTRWDQISWNALISGFSNLGSGDEAIKHFCAMRQEGFDVDFFTCTSILRAAGIISALEEGKQIHGLVLKTGYASNRHVQNGIVSMYARCGAANDSKRVFFSMEEHDLISWNSLLSGFAHHGYGREVVELFEQMRNTGINPDSTTYLLMLSACSHAGLLDKGHEYFQLMRSNHLFDPPKVEHYASIVDLYGRAGYLHEAEAFVYSMPIAPGPSVFKALLSACQVHGNMEVAERSAKELLKLCPNDPATYVLLSHVFTTWGNFDDAAKVRKLMSDRGVQKVPGYSQI